MPYVDILIQSIYLFKKIIVKLEFWIYCMPLHTKPVYLIYSNMLAKSFVMDEMNISLGQYQSCVIT